jgi:hypothetical protein
MGRECSTNAEEVYLNIQYWWESQRDHWEDQDVGLLDNKKMDLRDMGWGGMDYIDLALDKYQ